MAIVYYAEAWLRRWPGMPAMIEHVLVTHPDCTSVRVHKRTVDAKPYLLTRPVGIPYEVCLQVSSHKRYHGQLRYRHINHSSTTT